MSSLKKWDVLKKAEMNPNSFVKTFRVHFTPFYPPS